MTNRDRGPALALLVGAASWGVLWYPLRLFAAHGLGGVWLTIVIYGGALFFTVFTHRPTASAPRAALLALALTGGLMNIGFVLAVLQDNVLRVTLLFYLSPVWTVLLARIFLGERLVWPVVSGVGLAVMGVVIVLWHGQTLVFRPPDMLALGAGASFAAANVLLRAYPDISLTTKAQATCAGVVVTGLVAVIAGRMPLPVASLPVMALALVGGGAGILIVTALVQYGVSALPVRQSAVLVLAEVIAAAVSQHLWLHRPFSALTIGGAVVLTAGATLVARYEY
ncbi:MAG: DMT family transporter [Acidiferrobacter sp.]